MVDSPSEDEPPPFEEPFSGEDVEKRIFGTVLQTRKPTAASVIADRTGCDPKTARKYLRWDRHPNSHNSRDHFHPFPNALTPGEDASWPTDHRDVLTLVFDQIERRIGALWEA